MGKMRSGNHRRLPEHLKELLFVEGFMALAVGLAFSTDPVFPQTLSADFFQHLQVAQSVFPPLSQLLLYGDVEVFLWVLVHALPLLPIITVRYSMGVLVVLSPLMVYLSVRTLLGARAAIWTAGLYAFSGFVWFTAVFNVGLYPNFWGLLSSLMLLAGAKSLSDGFSAKKAGVYALLLVNALFSHYSALLVLPVVVGWFAWRRAWTALGLTLSPVVGGALAFPGLVATVFGFQAAVSGNVPAPTALSALIPLPTLSNMVALISADWLGDFAAVVVIGLGAYFVVKGHRAGVLVLAWFFLVVLYPVYGEVAWRYALVALMPLTVMAGWSLSHIAPKLTSFGHFRPGQASKALLVGALILVPTFGSWSLAPLYTQGAVATQQQYDLQAMQWLSAHLPRYCNPDPSTYQPCPIVALNDYWFLYYPYMGGGDAYYAAAHAIIDDPLQAQEYAANRSRYLVVSAFGTAAVPQCDPRLTFGLRWNGTASGGYLFMDIRTSIPVNTTVDIADGSSISSVTLYQGFASVKGQLHGNDSIIVALGTASTAPVSIARAGPYSASVPPDWCLPWSVYNPTTMLGWTVVYSNPGVRVYNETLS